MKDNTALAEKVESLQEQMAKKQLLVTRGLSGPAKRCLKILDLTFEFQLETLLRYRRTYGHVCPAATYVFPLDHVDPAAEEKGKEKHTENLQPLGEWCSSIRCLEKFGRSAHAHGGEFRGGAVPRPRVSPIPLCTPLALLRANKNASAGLLPEEYKSRLITIGFDFNSSSAYAKRLEAEKMDAAAQPRVKRITCQLCSESEVFLLSKARGEIVLAQLRVPDDASVSGGASRDDGCVSTQGTSHAAFITAREGEGEGEAEECDVGRGSSSHQLPANCPAGFSGSSTPAVQGSSGSLHGAGDCEEEGNMRSCTRSQQIPRLDPHAQTLDARDLEEEEEESV